MKSVSGDCGGVVFVASWVVCALYRPKINRKGETVDGWDVTQARPSVPLAIAMPLRWFSMEKFLLLQKSGRQSRDLLVSQTF